ncbi:unnamed protein product [Gongylonema pulchrum]|uniref:PhoLip_ATPase_N domain-containing protein n=1 Tax=Gongylonema pulchrum TaxID=637853 RepID=A0A183EZU3_9BILA|nr:unnamed protein product [Gongylonema pulchrum]
MAKEAIVKRGRRCGVAEKRLRTWTGGNLNETGAVSVAVDLNEQCFTHKTKSVPLQVYLVHLVYLLSVYDTGPFPIVYRGKYQFIYYCLLQLLISYFFGLFPAFVAEFPAINLEKLLLSSDKSAKPVASTEMKITGSLNNANEER